jgi:aryl-alcohol dehydrogenase-like predicted oxidoreductase
VTIPALGLGTAALASRYGVPGAERNAPTTAEAVATIETALQLGVRFIDTAPAYGNTEALVGAACEGTDCVIATKLAMPPDGWGALRGARLASHVRGSLERSLRALRRSHIDLLQIHNADASLISDGRLPDLLSEVLAEGAVLACGATVYAPDDALAVLACSVFGSVQVPFSALDRRAERQLVPVASAGGRALIARSVLLRGALSPAGRVLAGELAPLREAADRFRTAIGASWEELPAAGVAYALTRPGIACTLLGARDRNELEHLVDGARRFAGAARRLNGDWDAGLDAKLLDPRHWPDVDS